LRGITEAAVAILIGFVVWLVGQAMLDGLHPQVAIVINIPFVLFIVFGFL
jgi:hypothetical protein